MTPSQAFPTAVALGLLISGCATQQVQGTSSVEMLEPASETQVKTDKKGEATMSDMIVNSIPPTFKGELARPVYPAAALAAHAGQYVVNATVTIGTNGAVTEVSPTWQRMNVPGPFSALFFDAVRAAASQWSFEPARNVYWKKNGDSDPIYVNAETIVAKIDVRFTFDSSGNVR